MDLLSSIRGFFVGQRHRLVQSLPSFFAIALISTSTALALFVHRKHPTCNLIAVQEQQLIGQLQCTTQNYFYALKSVMQLATTDLFSSLSGLFIGQRHQLVKLYPLSSSSSSSRPLPAGLSFRHHLHSVLDLPYPFYLMT